MLKIVILIAVVRKFRITKNSRYERRWKLVAFARHFDCFVLFIERRRMGHTLFNALVPAQKAFASSLGWR